MDILDFLTIFLFSWIFKKIQKILKEKIRFICVR